MLSVLLLMVTLLSGASLLGCSVLSHPNPEEDVRRRAHRALEETAPPVNSTQVPYASERKQDVLNPPAPDMDTSEGVVSTSGAQKPAWLIGESRQYPPSGYITGVGSGQDRKTAEDRARAEIARIFHSEIDSSNRIHQEILESTDNGAPHTRASVNYEEVTRISTRKVISGVRIARVHEEKTGLSKTYFALAVLDRNQARAMLEYRIHSLDQEVRQLLEQVPERKDKLSRVRILQSCVEKYVLRQAYETELRIVNTGGNGIAPVVDLAEIRTRLEETLLRDFLIGISVEGNHAAEVRRALTEAFNKKGFAVSEDSTRIALLARGTVDIQPVQREVVNWKFVRWNAYFDLVDREGGAVFGSVQKSGRVGHLTLPQAEDRALRTMQRDLAENIAEELSRYIFNRPESVP